VLNIGMAQRTGLLVQKKPEDRAAAIRHTQVVSLQYVYRHISHMPACCANEKTDRCPPVYCGLLPKILFTKLTRLVSFSSPSMPSFSAAISLFFNPS
jgi:hypothetical protein